MTGWRDIKRRARHDLHKVFQVPALYRAPGSSLWAKCRIRVHDKIQQLGGVEGVNYIYSDREEATPRIVFLASEIIPVRGGVVSVDYDEAYRIDHTEPRDNITIEVDAYRLERADIVDFPHPGACSPEQMCEVTGFKPKAQHGAWAASLVNGQIVFGDQQVSQFNAPYTTHQWVGPDGFIPYQTDEAYDFTVDISGTSAVVDNYLELTFGSFKDTAPVTNEAGKITHKRFHGTVFALDTVIPITLSTRAPFGVASIRVSISPRANRTEESLVVGKFNTSYLMYALTRPYPEQVHGGDEVVFNMAQGTKTSEITADGCSPVNWFNGTKIAGNPKSLMDVQLRMTVTSQIAENYINFTLGDEVATRELPAAAGVDATITARWTALLSEDAEIKFAPNGPLILKSATLELIPR